MSETVLQRRPLYSIGTVSRLTGVKADTLRVWERRYQLGASHKAPSGRRMFTQSDLEHLQLVSALVSAGTRIGDIAGSERRTLEVMLRSRVNNPGKVVLQRKPRILFVGSGLCDWLDEHQGCLAGVDALLLSAPLAEVSDALLQDLEDIDGLIAEVGGLGEVATAQLTALAENLEVEQVLALHRFSGNRWLQELERRGYRAAEFPPDPAFLASHLSISAAVKDASEGQDSLSELVEAKPRLFHESELAQAAKQNAELGCGCPRHLAELVRTLSEFEEYSANCSVENWQDASLHACIFAYAGQARWLMEKALLLATEKDKDDAVAVEVDKPLRVEIA